MKNTPSRPFSPQIVYKGIRQRIARHNGAVLSRGMRGATINALTKACGGEENLRYVVTEFLFAKCSSKDLLEAEWSALYQWVAPSKNELRPKGAQWGYSEYLDAECQEILEALGHVPPTLTEKRQKIIERHHVDEHQEHCYGKSFDEFLAGWRAWRAEQGFV